MVCGKNYCHKSIIVCLLDADFFYFEVKDSSSVTSLTIFCKNKLSFLLTLLVWRLQSSGRRCRFKKVAENVYVVDKIQ